MTMKTIYGDYGDDDDNENETAPPTAEDEGEVFLPIRLLGVSLSGRRTTRFILRLDTLRSTFTSNVKLRFEVRRLPFSVRT